MLRTDILAKFEQQEILATPQRVEIAVILLRKPQHLSADQVMEQLRSAGSKVSKATVYNTLKLFCERGLVKECLVDPTRRFYDSTTGPHHHFYNTDTGELRDIELDSIEFLDLPSLPAGTRLECAEVTIRVCNTAE